MSGANLRRMRGKKPEVPERAPECLPRVWFISCTLPAAWSEHASACERGRAQRARGGGNCAGLGAWPKATATRTRRDRQPLKRAGLFPTRARARGRAHGISLENLCVKGFWSLRFGNRTAVLLYRLFFAELPRVGVACRMVEACASMRLRASEASPREEPASIVLLILE